MQLQQKRRDRPGAEDGAPERSEEDTTSREVVLLCAACGASIAREADRVALFGAHAHDRVNPAGVPFRIGCFRQADGCREVGAWSNEFPWFPRHAWRCVACIACGAHLGWRFRSPDAGTFLGLILAALREG